VIGIWQLVIVAIVVGVLSVVVVVGGLSVGRVNISGEVVVVGRQHCFV
jgi:hypothetical protein